ncbi:hypothetical protein E3E51_01680 [Thermococcus sp. 21S7]|nr:hypothetical protein [Thermococcus sp. 21S7]
MFIVAVATILFVLGVMYGNLIFLTTSSALFIIAGFYSFNLTFITANGDVISLEGAYPLAFVWWGFAVIQITAIIYYGLKGGMRNAG